MFTPVKLFVYDNTKIFARMYMVHFVIVYFYTNINTIDRF